MIQCQFQVNLLIINVIKNFSEVIANMSNNVIYFKRISQSMYRQRLNQILYLAEIFKVIVLEVGILVFSYLNDITSLSAPVNYAPHTLLILCLFIYNLSNETSQKIEQQLVIDT